MNIKKIKQAGTIEDITFHEGDILKVEIENDGTKNVYIGRFIGFDIKQGFRFYFLRETIKRMIFRHHTICSEGLFYINLETISKIEIILKKK